MNSFGTEEKEELEQLRAVASQLMSDINGIRDSAELLEMRCTLETTQNRLAELEALERIQSTSQEAIKSGMIHESNERYDDKDECPKCLAPIGPDTAFTVKLCCGAKVCLSCTKNAKEHVQPLIQRVQPLIQTGRYAANKEQADQILEQISAQRSCPMCESDYVKSTDVKNVKYNAIMGQTWAQLVWGRILVRGLHDVAKDRIHCLVWFEKAAAAGNVKAMMELRLLWQEGFLEEANLPPSEEEADKYLLQAAKHGFGKAQYQMGALSYLNDNPKDALIWFTLAAAQGYAYAQHTMGIINAEGAFGVRKSIFESIYWFRKAALKGLGPAHSLLAASLLEAKQLVFGGKSDLVGHSAHPEAKYWFGMFVGVDDMKRDRILSSYNHKRIYTICAKCSKSLLDDDSPDSRSSLIVCEKCRAVAYCSNECQVQHWNRYHKFHCKFSIGTSCNDEHIERVYQELKNDRCGCCGKLENDDGVTLQECDKCQAIAYCCEECRDQHWDMGHGIDCMAVDQWRGAMQAKR